MVELTSEHTDLLRKCFDILMSRGVPSEYNVGKVSYRLNGISGDVLIECEDSHLRVYEGMNPVFEVELTSSCGIVRCNIYNSGLWKRLI